MLGDIRDTVEDISREIEPDGLFGQQDDGCDTGGLETG
jgi:hypothetical protein